MLTKEEFEDLAYESIIVKIQQVYNVGYFSSPITLAEELVELISETLYPTNDA